ncbi:MAG: 1,3-beta-glucanase, partial [Actinomycetes bacterium]
MSARSALSAPVAVIISIAVAVTGLGWASSIPDAAASPSWQTAFRDDFNGSGLPNPSHWLLTLGTSYPGGPANFGTGEIQTMTNNPSNVDVRNGNL